jgi:hypothetical protein
MQLSDRIEVKKLSLLEFDEMIQPLLQTSIVSDLDLTWVKKTRVRLRNKEYAKERRREKREYERARNKEMAILYETVDELKQEIECLRTIAQSHCFHDHQ